MKKFLLLVCFAGLAAAGAFAQEDAAEIGFNFTRLNGSGTNQFALWVENDQGRYVKTIFVTRYTAGGGWEKRPASLSQWVKQSKVSNMSKTQVDALSQATPQNGRQTLRWDGLDERGAEVPNGVYTIHLEANLRNENRVIYSAEIPLGVSNTRRAQANINRKFVGTPAEADKGIITQVSVRPLR